MPTTSNEAENLHALCENFGRQSNKGETTAKMLSRIAGAPINSADYFHLVAAISSRFEHFQNFVESSALADRHKDRISRALKELGAVTHVEYAQADWGQIKKQLFTNENMLALDFAGGMVGQFAPVKLFSDEEARQHLAELKKAAERLSKLEDATAYFIANSINTVIFMIERLGLYGSTSVCEQLFQTKALLERLGELVPRDMKQVVKKAASTVAIIFGVLVAVDAGVTAIENHYTRLMITANEVGILSPSETKLLTPPESGGEAADAQTGEDPSQPPTET